MIENIDVVLSRLLLGPLNSDDSVLHQKIECVIITPYCNNSNESLENYRFCLMFSKEKYEIEKNKQIIFLCPLLLYTQKDYSRVSVSTEYRQESTPNIYAIHFSFSLTRVAAAAKNQLVIIPFMMLLSLSKKLLYSKAITRYQSKATTFQN